MSSSLTESERIARAQEEILRKGGIGPNSTIATLSRQPRREWIYNDSVPASIAYLHDLIARGLGDSYNYYAGMFMIKINNADVAHFSTLSGVDEVWLTYASAPRLEV